jgi:oligopeptide/dipeptide ABC transporter ATP-binding protein
MSGTRVLEVEGLTVTYTSRAGPIRALRDIDLVIDRGECLGLVGESGSGKSTAALAILGLLGPEAAASAKRITFGNRDLARLSSAERRALRGDRVSIVFQDPFISLNPALPIGRQVAEVLIHHRGTAKLEADRKAIGALGEVGLPRPEELARAYPHQLSGGMQQRVLIATALVCDPDLVILDEPTTALDVTVEAEILDLLEDLRRKRGLAMLFVTHNLGLVGRICDRVCVLYAGAVLETGPTDQVLQRPAHPYTKGLLASAPRFEHGRGRRLAPIPGRFPDLAELPEGCVFHPRCPHAEERCVAVPQSLDAAGERHQARCWKAAALRETAWPAEPPRTVSVGVTEDAEPLIEIAELRKVYPVRAAFRTGRVKLRMLGGVLPWPRIERGRLRAVDGISISIRPGEIVGLVGESGCGKSTAGRCAIRLVEPSAGEIRFQGCDILRKPPRQLRALRGLAQIVFQNPASSLNPRKTVGAAVGRAMALFSDQNAEARRRSIADLLGKVGLSPAYAERFPHQLSGGERQRVGIARALATKPKFIVCDEPVSALDVSVQATILNLLADLRDEFGLAYLFISHDLSVVAHIADRIAVMYGGVLMEEGPTPALLEPPFHPYTEALLSAVPLADPTLAARKRVRLRHNSSGVDRPERGCRFQNRCPRKLGRICEEQTPPAIEASPGHRIACHIPLQELRALQPVLTTL